MLVSSNERKAKLGPPPQTKIIVRIVSQACVNMMVLLTQTNDVVKFSLELQGDK